MNAKRCPFCNSEVDGDDWIVSCTNTDCPAYFFEGKIEVWDKRPREEELVETLQFYANPDNYYEKFEGDGTSVEADGGQRARDILKERL